MAIDRFGGWWLGARGILRECAGDWYHGAMLYIITLEMVAWTKEVCGQCGVAARNSEFA